jgi:hypothetical protein
MMAIQRRQVHSTLGSSYANDMQQQQHQHHLQYISSTAAAPAPFLSMMNVSSSSTKDTTMSISDNDDDIDAYDFGYRVVSPFEAERYTCTSAQSYDDGHAFYNDTPTTTVSYPPSGV